MDDRSNRQCGVSAGHGQYVVDRLGGLVMAIKSEVTTDALDRTVVTLHKSRGKLTVAEMQEYLQQHMPGVYVILLRAHEDAYDAWLTETSGDAQDLYPCRSTLCINRKCFITRSVERPIFFPQSRKPSVLYSRNLR